MPASTRIVALLRGINVGGHNPLPMHLLRDVFDSLGCRRVSTYIASGNVIFVPPPRSGASFVQGLERNIALRAGFEVRVTLRSSRDLQRVLASNPFLSDPNASDTRRLYVAFLTARPRPGAVATLDPDRSPPDRFVVCGTEVYLHLVNGAARTRITNAWLDAQLGTVSTARNWATVTKLAELARD